MKYYEPHLEWDRHEAEMDRMFPDADTLRSYGWMHEDDIRDIVIEFARKCPRRSLLVSDLLVALGI